MTAVDIERATYFEQLPLARIHPDPINPRKTVTIDDDFLASVTAGIIEPLVVRPDPNQPALIDGIEGEFLIVAGHRRHKAATILEFDTVPARILYDLTDADVLEMMLAENGQRQNLTPLEEAEAYRTLVEMGRAQRDIARHVGRGQGTISKRLSLLKLPERARTLLDAGTISVQTALGMTALLKHEKVLDRVLEFAELDDEDTDDRRIGRMVEQELERLKKPVIDKAAVPAVEKEIKAVQKDTAAAKAITDAIDHELVYTRAMRYCAAIADSRDTDGQRIAEAFNEASLALHDLMVAAGFGCECDLECDPGNETLDLTGAIPTADIATVTKNAEVDAAPALTDDRETTVAQEASTELETPNHQGTEGDEATEGAATSATPAIELPWAGYERLTANLIANVLPSRSPEQLRHVIAYERARDNRADVIDAATHLLFSRFGGRMNQSQPETTRIAVKLGDVLIWDSTLDEDAGDDA